jgi:hypothetical protein
MKELFAYGGMLLERGREELLRVGKLLGGRVGMEELLLGGGGNECEDRSEGGATVWEETGKAEVEVSTGRLRKLSFS